MGYLVYYRLVITPQVEIANTLTEKLSVARRDMRQAEANRNDLPNQLKPQVAAAQTSASNASKAFLSEAETASILDHLYQYAAESNVTIVDLMAISPTALPTVLPTATLPKPTLTPQPTATPTGKLTATPKGNATATAVPNSTTAPVQATAVPAAPAKLPIDSKTWRVKVVGGTQDLLAFMARIIEASQRSVGLGAVVLTEDKTSSTLTFEFVVYTSPYAPTPLPPTAVPTTTGVIIIGQTGTAAPTPLRATATPSANPNLVRPTNWPTEWAWPPRAGTMTPTPTTAQSQLTPTGRPVQFTIYMVIAGDDLVSIAKRYGTTAEAIMQANNMTDLTIRVGQQLRIPAP